MTFSSRIKQELADMELEARHCNIAELLAILNVSGQFVAAAGPACEGEPPGKFNIQIQSENAYVCKRCAALIRKIFELDISVGVSRNMKKKGVHLYHVFVGPEGSQKILNATGLQSGRNVSPLVVGRSCCKRAYVRGAFIASGSLSDPEKAYHAEFVGDSEDLSLKLMSVINSFSLNAKLITRKDSFIVYLKDSEQITDLLNIMQAHQTLMELANVRILKGVRNNINRKVNFETANLSKTATAAVKQVEDILFIKELKGLSYLNEQLCEVAALRLNNPDLSLKELGRMLTPAVSKSGVNHRFRKISEIADNLRGGSN